MKQQTDGTPCNWHEEVSHVATRCQGKRSALTVYRLHGQNQIRQLQRQNTGCWSVPPSHARLLWSASWNLSNAFGMHPLRRLKGAGLIPLLLVPDGKQDPDPHIGEGRYGDRVALPFCSFPLVIGLSPRFLLSRLPGELKQG